jgi:hypothetical protein
MQNNSKPMGAPPNTPSTTGAELLENPLRRKVMRRTNQSKSKLQDELDSANEYIEELENKLDSIAGIATGDEDEDEDSDSNDDQD